MAKTHNPHMVLDYIQRNKVHAAVEALTPDERVTTRVDLAAKLSEVLKFTVTVPNLNYSLKKAGVELVRPPTRKKRKKVVSITTKKRPPIIPVMHTSDAKLKLLAQEVAMLARSLYLEPSPTLRKLAGEVEPVQAVAPDLTNGSNLVA